LTIYAGQEFIPDVIDTIDDTAVFIVDRVSASLGEIDFGGTRYDNLG
jgi:hypothetical protein